MEEDTVIALVLVLVGMPHTYNTKQVTSEKVRRKRRKKKGAREMAWQIRALTAPVEDLSLVPSIHREAPVYNYRPRGCPLLASTGTAHTWCADIHAGKALRCIK